MNKMVGEFKKTYSFVLSYIQWKEDFFLLFLLFLLSIFFVYYFPRGLSNIFFLGLLFLFYRSKENYFWFAYFFILSQGPGWFFSDFSKYSPYRLPIYTVFQGISLTPLDLFIILAFIKALSKGKRIKLKLKNPMMLIIAYLFFSLFVTFIYGTDLKTLGENLRGPFYYSIIISFSYLIYKRKHLYYFLYLIIPFVFFLIFTQFYSLTTGKEFINLFYPSYRTLDQMEAGLARPLIGGGLLIFFSFIFSIFLLECKESKLSNKFLYFIIGLTYFAVIISATRVWFVIFSFILLGYIFISKMKILNSIKIAIVLFILILIFFFSGLVSPEFLLKGSGKRLAEILYVAKGEFKSVPTFEYRYFFRLPRLLEGMKKYIIFGCGFSKNGLKYLDFHVGFFNTILQFGIIGFSIFLYFFVSYFKLIIKSVKKLSNSNSFRTPIKILALIFGGILIGNFFTFFFFPMNNDIKIPFFIAIFLALTELFINEGEKEEFFMRENVSNE